MEIEIKVRVRNAAQLRRNITRIGGRREGRSHQVDTYYSLYHRPFTKKKGKVVRIREDRTARTGRLELHVTQNAVAGIEYEVAVDNVRVLKRILREKKAKPEIVVDKVRDSYRLGKFHIVIDRVKGLGTFCEVELLGANTVSNRRKVERVLERLEIPRRDWMTGEHYIDMALRKQGRMYGYF